MVADDTFKQAGTNVQGANVIALLSMAASAFEVWPTFEKL